MRQTQLTLRICTLLLAVVIVLGSAAPAVAVSTTVQTDAALPGQTHTKDLTFTFTPSSNTTVTATDQITRADGNVTFTFDSWERTDGAAEGSDRTWQVTAGEQYRVTYEVEVTGMVQDKTYEGRAYVEDAGGSTVTSERLAVSVDVLYPEFGYVDEGSPKVVFDDASAQSVSTTFDVSVPNSGRGAMVLTDVSFSNVPSGFSVEGSAPSGTIAAGTEGTVSVSATVDESVSAGSYSFTMRLTDNLGNTHETTVTVEVQKPPIASVSGSTIDVGNVLNGTTKEVEFTVNEVGGNQGISGLDISVMSTDRHGAISFRGTEYLSTQPGGSDTATVVVSVPDDAEQHADLSWTVDIAPEDENAPSTSVTVKGQVIHPALLDRVELSSTTIAFDRPKSSVSSFDQSTTVGIVNSGDLKMEVKGVSARMQGGSEYLSASISQAPATVEGLSTGEATLVISADPETPEGTYRVAVTVETAEAGTKTVVRTVKITQEPKLRVRNEVSYGDLTITENQTKTIDVTEHLEYESIEGLTIHQISGPKKWLTVVERPPSTVEAGQTAPFIIALQFDTSAKLYQQYQWTFKVSGNNVQTQNITVTARAKPYSFDQITSPLGERAKSGGWAARTASPMNEMLLSLEKKLKSDESVPSDDLSKALAAGRATLLFVDSLERARTAQEQGNHSEAQRALAQAAVAHDLMKRYVGQIEQRSLRQTGQKGVAAAGDTFEHTVETQQQHYASLLDANASLFQNAQAHRSLMRLNTYLGNEQAAANHRQSYQRASNRYLETIDAAAQSRATAEVQYAAYRANATIVLASYPLVLNPARLDAVSETIAGINGHYAAAASDFARAGASDEASSTRARGNVIASRLQVSWYSLVGATLLYVLLFLALVGMTSYNVYRYYRDATAAASGGFLVES